MEEIDFADCHIHPLSISAAKRYIKRLYKNLSIIENSDIVPTISFHTHYYNLSMDNIEKYLQFHKITYVKSLGIPTSDGIEIIIFNPDYKSSNYVEKMSQDREIWLNIILEYILEETDCILSISSMLKRSNKKIREIEIIDICEEICIDEYGNNIFDPNEVYEKYVKPAILEFPLQIPSMRDLSDIIKENSSYVVLPDNLTLIDSIFAHPQLFHINGLILNKKLYNIQNEIIKENSWNKKLNKLFGSGIYIY